MLEVFGRDNSVNVQKVLWACEELGVEYDRRDAGLSHGFPEGYEKLNPNMLVPTVRDGDFVLWESHAIVRYLASREGRLIPEDLRGRADCERWMDWQQTVLWEGLRPIFFALVRKRPEFSDPQQIESNRLKLASSLAVLDEHLRDRKYVLGEEFSVADIPLGVSAYRWFEMDLERPEMPDLRAYYERLRSREAFIRVCALPLT
ncbi:Glutathione S-transferase [Rubrobacter radiotolerans]|uniref:Glutathione S-transferase n=1 Tax=Rubrobacter radiotolerans TaxID=42256 RepID=A0A023WZ43_RUBRA|nr:glutathione S-transferase family protein [Rubrobacter radiotolerans]AHY45363.1 Glutathione S-transferase [Rubrobacter radiotolerans]MDX5892774.1 glutathione S-transferase family protein [Rubrobacter radiotolerans]SMC02472.1 glutathione S-transferase [Rubrobacter radiotolerans DSM 5868]